MRSRPPRSRQCLQPTTAADPAALAAATEAVELAAQAAEEASLAAAQEQAELPSERGGTRPAGMRGLEVLLHGDRSADWATYFVGSGRCFPCLNKEFRGFFDPN